MFVQKDRVRIRALAVLAICVHTYTYFCRRERVTSSCRR